MDLTRKYEFFSFKKIVLWLKNLILKWRDRSPLELYTSYDPSLLAFQPAVPAPSSVPINFKKLGSEGFHSADIENLVAEVDQTDYFKIWEENAKFFNVTSDLCVSDQV